MTQLDSYATIQAILRKFGRDKQYQECDAHVTAEVDGREVINDEVIKTAFHKDYDKAIVDIMWEDYGYKNYKDMGLYGRMNSDFQTFEDVGNDTLKITGDNYEILVNYADSVQGR